MLSICAKNQKLLQSESCRQWGGDRSCDTCTVTYVFLCHSREARETYEPTCLAVSSAGRGPRLLHFTAEDMLLHTEPSIFLPTLGASGATNPVRKSEWGGARPLSQAQNSLPVNAEERSRAEGEAGGKEDVAPQYHHHHHGCCCCSSDLSSKRKAKAARGPICSGSSPHCSLRRKETRLRGNNSIIQGRAGEKTK